MSTTNTRASLPLQIHHQTFIWNWTDPGAPGLSPAGARRLVKRCRESRQPAHYQQFRILRAGFVFMALAATAGWVLYFCQLASQKGAL